MLAWLPSERALVLLAALSHLQRGASLRMIKTLGDLTRSLGILTWRAVEPSIPHPMLSQLIFEFKWKALLFFLSAKFHLISASLYFFVGY